MRTFCVIALVITFGAQPLLADGPLARAIPAEAARLAAEAPQPSDPAGWRAVLALQAGTPIELTTETIAAPRIFVAADDTSVTVLNLGVLPERARRYLLDAARANPAAVAATARGAAKALNEFVIGPDGVFLRGVKLAEREDVIARVRAEDVVAVSAGLIRRGSAGAATVWAALGLCLAWRLGAFYTESAKGAALLIGVPIAAGVAGWYANSQPTDDVVYQRPATTQP